MEFMQQDHSNIEEYFNLIDNNDFAPIQQPPPPPKKENTFENFSDKQTAKFFTKTNLCKENATQLLDQLKMAE